MAAVGYEGYDYARHPRRAGDRRLEECKFVDMPLLVGHQTLSPKPPKTLNCLIPGLLRKPGHQIPSANNANNASLSNFLTAHRGCSNFVCNMGPYICIYVAGLP